MTQFTGLQYNDTNTATLAGLKQKIYFDGKCNALSIDDGDMNRIINTYYARVQERIRKVNENFYMDIATADLVAGDGTYTFPDGTGTAPAMEKLKSIWTAFTPANIAAPLVSEYVRVQAIDPDSITDPEYVFDQSQPNAQIFGTYFVLSPLVAAGTPTVTDGVKVFYIATQDKLVNDTDVPKIFPSFHDAIALGALIDVCHRMGNDDDSKDYEKKFNARLLEVEAYASNHTPEEMGIVEGQDTQGGWAYPWGTHSMA